MDLRLLVKSLLRTDQKIYIQEGVDYIRKSYFMRNRFLNLCWVWILVCILTGCSESVTETSTPTIAEETMGTYGSEPTPFVSVTSDPGPTQMPETSPISEHTPTSEPTPDPQKEIDEALRLASMHGLTEEDLHGEYTLFLEYVKRTEANENLNGYKEWLYRIFPVIVDNKDYIDREYLLNRVEGLSIIDAELTRGDRGEYDGGLNTVWIDTLTEETDEYHKPGTVFHELMHFLDHSAGSDAYSLYYFLDDKVLSLDEFLALPNEDQGRVKPCSVPDFLFEGGAELFTAKYFSGSVHSYFEACLFLSGIEYIYGTEKLKELFFSTDSDVRAAKLFFDAGYSYERYDDVVDSLNSLTYPDDCARPDNFIPPEEILVDLYKAEHGDGWETDREFRYILDVFNAEWDFCEAINKKVYAGLSFEPILFRSPPYPVIRNGKMTLGSYATWTDPETGENVRGTINAEYDFEREETVRYELLDTMQLPYIKKRD